MYKTKEMKSGISLIVLVITIIVVIIIAAAVILTLTSNNPISEAKKATFLSDIDTFRNDLDMYNAAQYASTLGNYDLNSVNLSVNADENLLYSAIPSLKGKTKYYNSFSVVNGALAYTGADETEIDWAKNTAGILTINAKPELEITTANVLPVKAGGSIVYTVAMTGTVPITTVNLSGNLKVLDNGGTELGTQPSISVGTVTGTTADKERSATVTINTTGMAEGVYKIKVLVDAVQTAGSKSAEKISTATFEIDNTAPAMPTITINPTTWTNGNVTATITKSNAADTLEYSTNGTTWNAYTTNLTITDNLTVYARETDTASNVSNVATKVITTIDKTAPTVVFGTNGASGIQTGNTTVTASDTSGSGINASTLQYVWDTQNSTTPSSGWNTFTNGGTLTKTGPGTFYLWIKVTDNAGNVFVTKSNVFTLVTPIYNFAYTGNYQTWTVPVTGTYKLEVWGAQGGYSNGGKGGYSVGNMSLNNGQTIYIYVGGQGTSSNVNSYSYIAGGFNGGGSLYTNTNGYYIGSGGGGTDIRLNGTALTNRIIVAGGGRRWRKHWTLWKYISRYSRRFKWYYRIHR